MRRDEPGAGPVSPGSVLLCALLQLSRAQSGVTRPLRWAPEGPSGVGVVVEPLQDYRVCSQQEP